MIALEIGGRRYETASPDLFIAGHRAGERAGRAAEDTDAYVRALYAQGDHAAVAGYLHGLASAARQQLPRHPASCTCPRCLFDRRELRESIYRVWREAAAA
ncbi:hypothetical protein EST92_19775 [Streptomyces sp. TM32]|uniref:hypothetical protein n=1 Tax=Streptomyces sp. TM32 TaxID=1652669 RepID=UPI001012485A|nr:hypothetical protein [Streptomyces sp. TM32]RXS78874.1 hypothetical protein EST92_19775 [Streptomyces sp. TM32]